MLNYFAPSPSVESYLEREGGKKKRHSPRACAKSDGDEKEEDLEDDVGVCPH